MPYPSIAVAGARGSSSRRAPRSPSRGGGRRPRACSGRGSPWRSPRRRRSRRWCASPPITRRCGTSQRGSEKPSTRQIASAPGSSRSSATESASMLVTCSPRRSIPAAERITTLTRAGRPQHAGEHLQAPLLGHLLGVVQAAERAAVGVRERARSRSGPRRRRAGRPGSRGRPRRRRRRSGCRARGRRRTGRRLPAPEPAPGARAPAASFRGCRCDRAASRWRRPRR